MKITINRDRFRELVAIVAPAAAKGASVTSGIHLAADDLGRVIATTTDYGLTIQAWAEADEVIAEGAIVVPAGLLLKILGSLPDSGAVRLAASSGGGGGVLECGSAHFELAGYPVEEFPGDALEGAAELGRVEVPREHLAAGLRACSPFAATSASSPLECVLLELGANRLAMAATDGHRLGAYETPLDTAGRRGRWLIPSGMASALAAALAADAGAEPWIAAEARELHAVVGRVTIRGRVDPDLKFPDYRRVFPAVDARKAATCNRAVLSAAVRRVAAVAMRDKGSALVTLEFTDAGVNVEASSADLGKATDRLDLFAARNAEFLRIGLNAGFLLEALAVFGQSENVEIQTSHFLDPVLLTSTIEPSISHVCMPMKL